MTPSGNIFLSQSEDNTGARPRNYVRHLAGDYPKMLYRKDGYKKVNSADEEAALVADGYSLQPVPMDEPKPAASAVSVLAQSEDFEELQQQFNDLRGDHEDLRKAFEKFADDARVVQARNSEQLMKFDAFMNGPGKVAQDTAGLGKVFTAPVAQAGLGPAPVSTTKPAEAKKG